MAECGRGRRSWRVWQADDRPTPVAGSGRTAGPGPAPVADASGATGATVAALPTWYERLGAEVLAELTFPWAARLPGWTVRFLPGRDGLLGGTWTYERRIEIYVRAGQPRADVAFTVAHELGHAVDVSHFGEVERRAWSAQRGLGAEVPWWVESGTTDLWSGSGDWAEAVAVWLVGGRSHSRIAPQPSPADLAVVARLANSTPALAA